MENNRRDKDGNDELKYEYQTVISAIVYCTKDTNGTYTKSLFISKMH